MWVIRDFLVNFLVNYFYDSLSFLSFTLFFSRLKAYFNSFGLILSWISYKVSLNLTTWISLTDYFIRSFWITNSSILNCFIAKKAWRFLLFITYIMTSSRSWQNLFLIYYPKDVFLKLLSRFFCLIKSLEKSFSYINASYFILFITEWKTSNYSSRFFWN